MHPYTFTTSIYRDDTGHHSDHTAVFLATPEQQDADTLLAIAKDWLLRLHRTLSDTSSTPAMWAMVQETDHFIYDDTTDKTINSPYHFIGKVEL